MLGTSLINSGRTALSFTDPVVFFRTRKHMRNQFYRVQIYNGRMSEYVFKSNPVPENKLSSAKTTSQF